MPHTILALDPSLTATGWAVIELGAMPRLVDAGVVRTAPAKQRLRVLQAEDDARRGLEIRRAIRDVLERHRPALAAQEANAGSKSAKSAGALHRAQQACVDAVDAHLGAPPMFIGAQEVKRLICGRRDASKEDVEARMRERLGAIWDACLVSVAPKKRENAFDAGAVGLAVWDRPEVAALRRIGGAL